MPGDILNNVSALVLPKLTNAQIAALDANAEMGSLFYDTTNNKLMFVKNGGGSETVTSA
jgi:hypothetical protein